MTNLTYARHAGHMPESAVMAVPQKTESLGVPTVAMGVAGPGASEKLDTKRMDGDPYGYLKITWKDIYGYAKHPI